MELRLCGLPWSCPIAEHAWLHSVCALAGVGFVSTRDAGQSGEVSVELESEDEVKPALKRQGEHGARVH